MNWQTSGLFLLAQINGIIHYHCYKKYDNNLISIHPTVPRHFFHIPSNIDNTKNNIKNNSIQFVSALNPDYEWEKTKTGSFKPHCYDMSDAYVLSLYGYHRSIISTITCDENTIKSCIELYEETQKVRTDKLKSKLNEEEYSAYVYLIY